MNRTLSQFATIAGGLILGSALFAPVLASAHEKDSFDGFSFPAASTAQTVVVGSDGQTLVRGAKVTAISGNTISASTVWGSFTVPFSVVTSASTSFVGGASTTAGIAVGDLISFSGMLDQTKSAFTVLASAVRDWTATPAKPLTLRGTVGTVSTSTTSFTLAGTKEGTLTVNLGTNASILKNGTTTTFASVVSGSAVSVTGAYDSASDTLTATTVTISSKSVWPLPLSFHFDLSGLKKELGAHFGLALGKKDR